MKLGIMGTGLIVGHALPVLAEHRPEKCFLMGREHSAARTEELCRQYGLDGWVLSMDELLSKDIDTVYVALPNQLHFSAAKRAVGAGKNVILEKPATPTAGEWDELVRDADKNGVFILEAMTTPHMPAFVSLREKIPELGRIRGARFRFDQYSSRYDAFQKGEVAPAFDPACLGGALMDLNVYNLHALVCLFGKPLSASYDPQMQRGIDTSGTVTLDYGTFRATSEAAKDKWGPLPSEIHGEQADLVIPVSLNGVDRYEIREHTGRIVPFDFQTDEHRLTFEFLEFERIFREKDQKRAKELNETTRVVTELLEQLRPY